MDGYIMDTVLYVVAEKTINNVAIETELNINYQYRSKRYHLSPTLIHSRVPRPGAQPDALANTMFQISSSTQVLGTVSSESV